MARLTSDRSAWAPAGLGGRHKCYKMLEYRVFAEAVIVELVAQPHTDDVAFFEQTKIPFGTVAPWTGRICAKDVSLLAVRPQESPAQSHRGRSRLAYPRCHGLRLPVWLRGRCEAVATILSRLDDTIHQIPKTSSVAEAVAHTGRIALWEAFSTALALGPRPCQSLNCSFTVSIRFLPP